LDGRSSSLDLEDAISEAGIFCSTQSQSAVSGKIAAVDQDGIVSWVMQCRYESGGSAGNIGHDPHLLYMISAVKVLALYSSFLNTGDIWAETYTRCILTSKFHFDLLSVSYLITISCLQLLHCLEKINVEKAVEYIVSCKNLDGGFGCTPGGEFHAGQIICCVGTLTITGSLHHIDMVFLGWWLCERRVKSGGLNGRPEMRSDFVNMIRVVFKNMLDKENGGMLDRSDDVVDVFLTYFGTSGLLLLEYPKIKGMNPAYALPIVVVKWISFTKKDSA
ncbi:hypothetical protein MKW98_027345, partial [Papaver atlanticum]